ncbi:MAG: hypothetical protein AAF493_14980, partial [Pseudomonadota bacterium]
MSIISACVQSVRLRTSHVCVLLAVAIAGLFVLRPTLGLDTGRFVLLGMLEVAPLVIPGVFKAALINPSGANQRVGAVLPGRIGRNVLAP